MSLNATLFGAVDTVFEAVGDLKKTAKVRQERVSGWDVATGKPIDDPQDIDVDVIMISETTAKNGVVTAELIFKSSQLPVDMDSTFLIDGKSYRIIPPVEDYGFVIQLKAKREQ